jgi:hypothetical protein
MKTTRQHEQDIADMWRRRKTSQGFNVSAAHRDRRRQLHPLLPCSCSYRICCTAALAGAFACSLWACRRPQPARCYRCPARYTFPSPSVLSASLPQPAAARRRMPAWPPPAPRTPACRAVPTLRRCPSRSSSSHTLIVSDPSGEHTR